MQNILKYFYFFKSTYHLKSYQKFSVSLFFSLIPTFVCALGFGEVKLYSYLNEPLDAEIELLGAENFEPSRILVTLASAQEFNRAGLARPILLSNMQFQVERRDNKTYIKISSNDAIHQPYLEYLLDLSWPGGRLVRGYTLLLDPAPQGTLPLNERRPNATKIPNELNFNAQNTPPNTIQTQIQNTYTPETRSHQDRFEKLFDEKSPESFTHESPPMTIVSTVPLQNLDDSSQNLIKQNSINKMDSLNVRTQNFAQNQNQSALQNYSSSHNQGSSHNQSSMHNQVSPQNNPISQNLLAMNHSQNSNNNNAIAVDKNHFWFAVTSFSILTLFIALFIVLSRRRKFSVLTEQQNSNHLNFDAHVKSNFNSDEMNNSNSFSNNLSNGFPNNYSNTSSSLNFANQDHTYLLDETTKNISDQVSMSPVQNEMNMKLELARYYLEIEDEENALQLLRDVLVRGSDWEKQQAQKLLEANHKDQN